MTRRNITEHKISSNILSHNSPIAVQNFDSLNLGPQIARHKRFASSYASADTDGNTDFVRKSYRGSHSLGQSKSGKSRSLHDSITNKAGSKVYPLPFGPPMNQLMDGSMLPDQMDRDDINSYSSKGIMG